MTTTFSHFYKTAMFGSTRTGSLPASAKARATRRPSAPTIGMPASLWRHSQSEAAPQARHHGLANRLLLGLAGLSLGGVAYAIHQTCSLMTDNRLHDAVAAFAR